MIVLLNGAFGIGKTTVARLLARRLKRAAIYNPEPVGVVLQRLLGHEVGDFQDLSPWRRLTIRGVRIRRTFHRTVIVPMAFTNLDYLQEIIDGIRRFDADVVHVCLCAPVEVVHERLRRRGDASAWEFRRAAECCIAHAQPAFAIHIDAADRTPQQIVDAICAHLGCTMSQTGGVHAR